MPISLKFDDLGRFKATKYFSQAYFYYKLFVMATRRLKLTGFARFFIVMLFLVPVAYLGAAYYNGQDGIQNIKDLLGIKSKTETTERVEIKRNENEQVSTDSNETKTTTPTNTSLNSRRLDQLEKRMNDVERENSRLREQIRRLEAQVKTLQQ